MSQIAHKILDWFTYSSTWKGVITFLTGLGVAISPELAEKIISMGLGVVGLIQFFWDHTKPTNPPSSLNDPCSAR